jgi:GR25 family glycosyltransferase involved in LPS biosynthesis
MQAAAALLPERLIVISIDKERLQRFHSEAVKYSKTVFSRVTNLEDPVIISRPAVQMDKKGTLEDAMRQWSATWNLANTQLRLGEIGCGLAHLAALQNASNGKGVVAICEDDVLFREASALDNLRTLLVANTVPGAWGLLRIGQHTSESSGNLDPLAHTGTSWQLTKKTKLACGGVGGARWGTYFYTVTPEAAKNILDILQKHPALYDTPSDVWVSNGAVCKAADIKFLEPSFVKYRTDVVSTTAAFHSHSTSGSHSGRASRSPADTS